MDQLDVIRTNITRITEARRMTQNEVAEKAGLTREAVRLFINGGDMRVSNICKIADALRVRLSWLAMKRPVNWAQLPSTDNQ